MNVSKGSNVFSSLNDFHALDTFYRLNIFHMLNVLYRLNVSSMLNTLKGEAISLIPLYHFYPLHRHLDISRTINTECSPLHIAKSRTRTKNFIVFERKSPTCTLRLNCSLKDFCKLNVFCKLNISENLNLTHSFATYAFLYSTFSSWIDFLVLNFAILHNQTLVTRPLEIMDSYSCNCPWQPFIKRQQFI